MRSDNDRIEFLLSMIEVDKEDCGVAKDAKNMIEILRLSDNKYSKDELWGKTLNQWLAVKKEFVRNFTDSLLDMLDRVIDKQKEDIE